jgi:hypothetical protein
MEYFRIYHLSKIESSKLINYLTNMCGSGGQGTTVVVRQRKMVNKLSFYDDKDKQMGQIWFCSGPNHPKSVFFRKA